MVITGIYLIVSERMPCVGYHGRKLQTTNLYLDERTYEKSGISAPECQGIVAERSSILVFADDDPLANFSHECRYLLHDPQTGDLHKEIPAQFPPFINGWPEH